MSPMNNRLMRPRAASGGHPDALKWASEVSAQGGSVSSTTLAAVSKFCQDIDAAGIRDRFYRLNLFCGNSDGSLFAPRVPLYRGPSLTGTQYGHAIDANSNFVPNDYAESGSNGGLTGASTGTRCLDTGLVLNIPAIASTGHFSVYRGLGTTTAGRAYIGCLNAAFTQIYTLGIVGAPTAVYDVYHANASPASGIAGSMDVANENALLVVSRTASNAMSCYKNTTVIGNTPTASSGSNSERTVTVFQRNQGALNSSNPVTIRSYSIGASLSAANVSAFKTALEAFFTAIGRTFT